MKDIGKNIKQLRTDQKLTQDDLAEKLFVTRQTVSNYENGKSRPDVDMLTRIAEILETDVNSLIYGPAPDTKKAEQSRLIIGVALTILSGLLYAVLAPVTRRIAVTTYDIGWWWSVEMILRPMFFLFAGWTLMQMLGMAIKREPLNTTWALWLGRSIVLFLILILILTLWVSIAEIVNQYLYTNHIRGEWIDITNQITGTVDKSWSSLPAPIPDWVSFLVSRISFYITDKFPFLYSLMGTVIWYFGIPKRKEA